MKAILLSESGYLEALYGLGLSHNATAGMTFSEFKKNRSLINKMKKVTLKLKDLDGGHNKFLESIQVWIELDAPRWMWQTLDTYRVGISKQSESSNHTLLSRPLTKADFDSRTIEKSAIDLVNKYIKKGDAMGAKDRLPESFLQKRIINVNYKTLRNIYQQRKEHKYPQLREFCKFLIHSLRFPSLIVKEAKA